MIRHEAVINVDRTTLTNDPARGARPSRTISRLCAPLMAAAALVMNLALAAHGATTAGDPGAMVKAAVAQVLEVLQNRQMGRAEKQRTVIAIVDRDFDFGGMARSALGYNWKKLSPAQQQEFVPLFTAFMEDAYLNKISSYSGQQVRYLEPVVMQGNTAEVKTVIQPAQSADQPIHVDYLVENSSRGWRVYDVTVDDISITANYRNQFNRMINERGFDGLISAMREKQQELRQSIGA